MLLKIETTTLAIYLIFYIIGFMMNVSILDSIEWHLNERRKKAKVGRFDMPWYVYFLSFFFFPIWIWNIFWFMIVMNQERRRRNVSKK